MNGNRGALTIYRGGTNDYAAYSGASPSHPSYQSWGILRSLAEFCASFMRRDLRALTGPDREDVLEKHKFVGFEGFALMNALANYETVANWALRNDLYIRQGLALYDDAINCGTID